MKNCNNSNIIDKMKGENYSKAISAKLTNATDYSGEHKAWQ